MLLDEMSGMGGMGGLDPQMFQQLMQQYQQSQANPFTQNIPGTEYLGTEQPIDGAPQPQIPLDMQGSGGVYNPPTDFAGTSPGLPNLPQSMQGFGFGQTAPEQNVNGGLRERLVSQLLNSLMSQHQGLSGGMGSI